MDTTKVLSTCSTWDMRQVAIVNGILATLKKTDQRALAAVFKDHGAEPIIQAVKRLG